jgi:hypothetical protein
MLAVIVCLDYKRYFLGGKFQNSKLFCHFYYTERLPQVIYVRLLHDCSNFVYSCRFFGISELQTV